MTIKDWKDQNTARSQMDLTGCTILADECDVYDKARASAVHAPGSYADFVQKQGVKIWNDVTFDPERHWYEMDSHPFWDMLHDGWKETTRITSELLQFQWIENEGKMSAELLQYIMDNREGAGMIPYMVVLQAAKNVAEKLTKPFDVSIVGNLERTRVVTYDVPYTVKVGFFRKETRYKQEQKTETYSEMTQLKFNGWLLDSFYRVGDGRLDWLYCLGSDGKLYIISTYLSSDDKRYYKVNEIAPMFPNRVRLPNDNILIAASHGWMGALDAVAPDKHPYVTKDEYDLDMPMRLEKSEDYPFVDGFGTLTRLARLIGLPDNAFIAINQ